MGAGNRCSRARNRPLGAIPGRYRIRGSGFDFGNIGTFLDPGLRLARITSCMHLASTNLSTLPRRLRAAWRRRAGGGVELVAAVVAVLAIVFAAPAHQFLVHGPLDVVESTPAETVVHGCGHAHHGCGHDHGPAAPDTEVPAPCDGDAGDCDTCTLLAGSPTWATPEVGDHPRPAPAGFVVLDRGTSRDIWGPSDATSRGPPIG